MIDELVLHVGLQKTGSTALQRNLLRQRALLGKAGLSVFRLRARNETDLAVHLPDTTTHLRSITHGREAPEDSETRARAELETSFAHPPSRTVLLTDENMLGPVNLESGQCSFSRGPEAIGWLVANIPHRRARICLYVRRQDTFIESTYLHRIHVGRTIRWERYLDRLDPSGLEWDRIADGLSEFGELVVTPFETIEAGGKAYLDGFLRDAGFEDPIPGLDALPDDSNRSYSALALEIALRCNELVSGDDQRALRAFLQEKMSNRTHPRAELLDDARRTELFEFYREGNERLHRAHLRARYGDAYDYSKPPWHQ